MIQSMSKRMHGFTLVELMITVAIFGIVVAIALPSYLQQVQKGQRSEGTTFLVEIAQLQERFFMENNTYTSNMNDLGYTGNATWVKSPEQLYRVRVQTTAGCAIFNCFRLLADPLKASQTDDGRLRLWSDGRRQRLAGGGWQNGWD